MSNPEVAKVWRWYVERGSAASCSIAGDVVRAVQPPSVGSSDAKVGRDRRPGPRRLKCSRSGEMSPTFLQFTTESCIDRDTTQSLMESSILYALPSSTNVRIAWKMALRSLRWHAFSRLRHTLSNASSPVESGSTGLPSGAAARKQHLIQSPSAQGILPTSEQLSRKHCVGGSIGFTINGLPGVNRISYHTWVSVLSLARVACTLQMYYVLVRTR